MPRTFDRFTTPPPSGEEDAQAVALERDAWRALAAGHRDAAATLIENAAHAHHHEPPARVMLNQPGPVYRAAVCARIARELRGQEGDGRIGAALKVAAPGWSLDYLPHTTASGLRYGSSTLSGYGDDWTAHVHELPPDAPVIDTRPIPADQIVTFAVSGPMAAPEVPAGMRDSLSAGLVLWHDQPQPDRDPRFGTARSFDRVALDVYARIAERFGARVLTVRDVLAGAPITTRDEAPLNGGPR
jgi:hypothetical protein